MDSNPTPSPAGAPAPGTRWQNLVRALALVLAMLVVAPLTGAGAGVAHADDDDDRARLHLGVGVGGDDGDGEDDDDEEDEGFGLILDVRRNPQDPLGYMDRVNDVIDADNVHGYATGRGVGVALIDTGVVPVPALQGKVVNGPDLSFDSQYDELRHLDAYGHGTHLAGIIVGEDDRGFRGVAPGAHLVNVKVGAFDGGVDVSQVIAAIDWVVEHREELDIRVLNLSYGTNGVQAPLVDPLVYAVENAWERGIVVVVSAGNDGLDAPVTNPAVNPNVLVVGSADLNGTTAAIDDTISDFSSSGTRDGRRVDLVAPGRSIVSLRSPGSLADTEHPEARIGEDYFRGSGSSQAAAVVSGAVALLLERQPHLTPDQVKKQLTRTATPLPRAWFEGRREARMIDVDRALRWRAPSLRRSAQGHPAATGAGSLEAARGDAHVAHEGVELVGEQDIFGLPWDGPTWAAATAAEDAWVGGTWMGRELAGPGWGGESFAEQTWAAMRWRADSWAAMRWRSDAWEAMRWRGDAWEAMRWRDHGWEAMRWRTSVW